MMLLTIDFASFLTFSGELTAALLGVVMLVFLLSRVGH